ncbi:cell division protein FtsI [Gluconobacter oxydans]|uniref:peptidoglycan D,D-transpeptidase FtsI family protein n=1 Tax=Gluconobacter thailandicus TaxID=257438 RepID=UPI0002998650|nr:penicillin-binding protein 2 [Gluconobacter thailandicus]AFW01889.1 transpeptidase FtsI [Gluconobacter oxydans H24]ANQ42522.1 cell division protein FtsI [Gluconobacter oxydans]
MPQDVPPPSGSRRAARQNKRAEQRGSQAAGPKLSSRRLNLDQMHGRLLVAGMGFLAIYGAVALKATFATVLMPMEPEKRQIAPQVPEIPKSDPRGEMAGDFVLPSVKRATITDRNGQALALSLPVAQVYANPMELIDPEEATKKLKTVLPKLDEAETVRRLSLKKQFVYIARDISPVQEIAINNLGIPGIYFEAGERRHYPLGRTAAQIMGSVDIDDHGIAGVERFFDQRLNSDRTPLRLSLDVRVQAVAHDELAAAKDEFSAIGASAIVMDVRTGEILAMVSLPDYDANEFNHAPNDARFNRAVTGMYEPGSTFKLQTAAMGLQLGVVHIWDRFSTIPIRVGRFTIRDMKTDHFAPWLSLPGVLAYSSNPAAAHIALDVGAQRQQEWLRNMGFFNRVPVELPEAGRPLVPASKNWGLSTVMTVGFGHGVAEPPLAIVRGTAATVNGGILLKPTLVARDQQDEAQTPDAKLRPVAYKPDETDNGDDIGAQTPVGTRVLSEKTSALLRKLLRLDVTVGSGKSAEVPGYYVGGKTGTAEKIGAHGGYLKHVNVSAFTSVFPMNNPHYAVYVMLDSPQGTAATHGWTTAAWNAAPTVKKIISRVGPILNQFPDTANKDAIEASLAIPMNPSVPTGYRALGPGNDPGDPRNQAHSSKTQH